MFFNPYACQSFRRHGLTHFEVDFFDLAIVLEKARSLQGVDQNFPSDVVEVTASPVRRIKDAVHCDRTFKHFCAGLPDDACHDFAILSAVAADKHPRPDVPVVMVEAWWPWKLQFDHYFAHGGVADAVALG